MTMANKARLDEFKKRGVDAERLGHALLECSPATKELVCDKILHDLGTIIASHETTGASPEVPKRSFEDCLRAMDRQKIKEDPSWRAEFDAVIALDKRVAEARRLAAAQARQTVQDRKDFEAWQVAKRSGASGNHDGTSANGHRRTWNEE